MTTICKPPQCASTATTTFSTYTPNKYPFSSSNTASQASGSRARIVGRAVYSHTVLAVSDSSCVHRVFCNDFEEAWCSVLLFWQCGIGLL